MNGCEGYRWGYRELEIPEWLNEVAPDEGVRGELPRWAAVRRAWQFSSQWRSDAKSILDCHQDELKPVACVLASGSLGRYEANPNSDADLLIMLRDGEGARCDPDQLWSHVQAILAPLGLRRPNPGGTYARCLAPEDLWRSDQHSLSPEPYRMGARLQILLDATPLWRTENCHAMYHRAIGWFDAGSLPCEPWWSYLFDEVQRYYRSLRILLRQKPATERDRRWCKHVHSRFLTWAAFVATIAACDSDDVRRDDLPQHLARGPQQRLMHVFARYHWDASPWLEAYDSFLRGAETGTWPVAETSSTLQANFQAFLDQRRKDWSETFLQYFLF